MILGLGWAMLLCFVQVGFWIELFVQRRLCPIFVKIIGPDKWDITVRYRVTRYPRVFRRLTVGQRTLGFWGVISSLCRDTGFECFDKTVLPLALINVTTE